MKHWRIALITFAAVVALSIGLSSCAGLGRDVASFSASQFGSDWVVLQYGYDGTPINCWKLQDTAIDNETNTDGIYWKDATGHLVHISGWYNRVQVAGSRFNDAALLLGVDMKECHNGHYAAMLTHRDPVEKAEDPVAYITDVPIAVPTFHSKVVATRKP